jgi:hypothetical protein
MSCVARNMWGVVAKLTNRPEIVDSKSMAKLTNRPEIVDFESMAKLWIRDKTLKVVNVLTTTVIWCLWKIRNDMCFQGTCWTGMRRLFEQCASFLRNWRLLNRLEAAIIMEEWAHELELRSTRPPRLTWECQVPTVVCVQGSKIQPRNGVVRNLECQAMECELDPV